jgi:hypothetical protein
VTVERIMSSVLASSNASGVFDNQFVWSLGGPELLSKRRMVAGVFGDAWPWFAMVDK